MTRARALRRDGEKWRARKLSWLAAIKRRRKVRDATMRIGRNEVVKLGAARFDLHDPYHLAIDLSWTNFALAVFATHITINVVFALLYLASPGSIANARPGSFPDAFFFSVETLATVGYGVMAPATLYGHIVSSFEIVVGMAFTAITTGLLFFRFSKPRPNILYADQVVVTTHDRTPTLMVRIANGRLTLLTRASAKLGLLIYERSEEGHGFRRMHELALSNNSMSFFPLTWTLMHKIDETSPLSGYDAERLSQSDAQLFVSVEARDHALGAYVQDMRIYTAADILFGMHYADAVTFDERRRAIADLARLSILEPDAANDGS